MPDETKAHITVYDLGVAAQDRVDHHLRAVKTALLSQEPTLVALQSDCSYALWIYYSFPPGEGAINLPPAILTAFGHLRVEIILLLNDVSGST
jgi:hypothetical protein